MLVVINIDSLMHSTLCGKLCRPLSQLLFAHPVVSLTDSQLFIQNRDLYLPHLHSMTPLRGPPSKYRRKVWCEKLEWFGYLIVKKVQLYDYLFGQN